MRITVANGICAPSTPTYTAIHNVLSNPVHAGAYTYGKTQSERYVDAHGDLQDPSLERRTVRAPCAAR